MSDTFLKKKKEKKWQFVSEPYKNLPQDEKQKLVEYKKNIIKWGKMLYYNYKKLFSFGTSGLFSLSSFKSKYIF